MELALTAPQTAPFGSWKSPLTADLIVAGSIRLGMIALDGADIYWIEGRPAERGRQVIVRQRPDGTREDVNPAPFNARTRVHEYGGGDFAVHEGTVYFSNFADQRLYTDRAGQGTAAFDPCRRPPLRRRRGRCAAQPPDLSARGPQRHRRGEERHRRGGSRFRRRDAARRRRRFLRQSAPQPRRHDAGLARLEPPQHALGRLRTAHRDASTRTGFRGPRASIAGGRGRGRVPAAMVAGRRAPFRLRPHRLVEPLPLARRQCRGHRADGGGVRRAPVGLRALHLWLRRGRAHHLRL